jgi:hypothetical protein
MIRFQISKLGIIKFIILSIHTKSGNLKQSFFIAIILVLERLNIFIMPISDVSSWKTYFLKTPKLEFSNSLLKEIRQSVDPSLPFFDSVKEISKNDGITFLSLDPSEDRLQLFHHTTVIGGSWNSNEEKIAAIHGFDKGSIPVQLAIKSIHDVKAKSFSLEQFAAACSDIDTFAAIRSPKMEFLYRNIVPLPHLLTKVFIDLPDTEPMSVALAFFHAMYAFDESLDTTQEPHDFEPLLQDDSLLDETHDEDNDHALTTTGTADIITTTPSVKTSKNTSSHDHPRFLRDFLHVIQFCHLCAKGKVTPVHFSMTNSGDVKDWFESTTNSIKISLPIPRKRLNFSEPNNTTLSDESDLSSPDQKISRKDQHFISAMLKLNETINENILKSIKDKEDKEPGFNRLETHKKNLILNASASPPFDTSASNPTEFYATFLAKKSQFKAKEMLSHRLIIDSLNFNPNSHLVACLWNCEFLWLTPDLPSGTSIFFCPETSTINSKDLERERSFALADKIKQDDIDKLPKQKMCFPLTIMEAVWMTQNYHSLISLCFGQQSHSALFLESWANHMYKNRLMYKSLQASDNTFFSQVLFAIDRALQIHW